MKLSAPRQITFVIAVVLGLLGLLDHAGTFSVGSVSDFVLVATGFVLLALGSFFKGL